MSTRGFHTPFVIQNSCNSRAMRYVSKFLDIAIYWLKQSGTQLGQKVKKIPGLSGTVSNYIRRQEKKKVTSLCCNQVNLSPLTTYHTHWPHALITSTSHLNIFSPI